MEEKAIGRPGLQRLLRGPEGIAYGIASTGRRVFALRWNRVYPERGLIQKAALGAESDPPVIALAGSAVLRRTFPSLEKVQWVRTLQSRRTIAGLRRRRCLGPGPFAHARSVSLQEDGRSSSRMEAA